MTPKQEAFAQAVVGGANQTDAYRVAGYSTDMLPQTVWEAASRLANDYKVATRIQELRGSVTRELVTKTVWSRERLIDKAEVSYDGAIDSRQYSAANGALKLISETLGYSEAGNQSPVVQVTKVTVVLQGSTMPKVVEESGAEVAEPVGLDAEES